jgi:predicted TIM-barrel fold metal-dependent hydrolase
MTIAGEPRLRGIGGRATRVRCVDTDIHNDLPSLNDLRPFLASEWHPFLDGGPGQPVRYWANQGSGRMDDSVNEADNLCAGDPQWVIEKLMQKYRIDVGILTGTLRPGIQHNARLWTALCSAYNDWALEKWVRPYDYFKGSIFVAAQDPEAAAAEIHRLGDDPGMVQVFLTSASRDPYGQKRYWPIYRAAVEHGLPVATHVGLEGTGIANPLTSVGYATTFLEFHTDLAMCSMAHCVSLIAEGVFEEFPTLKFAILEAGISWVPHVMWRMDRSYKALKAEVPYLKRLPSEYLVEHMRFSTQPIEEPPEGRDLLAMYEMMQAERTVLFASDYPHWDFDNPLTAFSFFPADLKQRIFVDNAVELYGERLLGPSR